MTARMKNQLGFALLGAVLLAVGGSLMNSSESGYGTSSAIGSGLCLLGAIFLLVFGGGLILDLIRARDED